MASGDECDSVALFTGGGYDCEFIDSIPDSLSCSVCLLPFRDPHLLDCCGIKLCESCVGRIEAAGQPCPHCRSDKYKHIADPSISRQVLGKQVYCERKSNGCKWVGELRHLEEHNMKECGWAVVQCRYNCSRHVLRHQLAQHELEECPQRPLEVRLESYMHKTEERHKNELMAVRNEYATKIEQLEKRIIDQQTEYDSKIEQLEKRIIDQQTEYDSKTTDQLVKIEQLERKITDQQTEYKAKMEQMVQSIDKLTTQRESTDQQVIELDKGMKKIIPQCDMIGARFYNKAPPIEFIITDYKKLKQKHDTWCSTPFYSGPEGYKFCLKVGRILFFSNGVSLYLLKGENDDNLKWPISTHVVIQVVNQKNDQDHHELICTSSNNDRVSSETAVFSSRFSRQLEVCCVSYDRLVIRVLKIDVLNE